MSDGYRKAALSLHGLGKSDQKWLLSKLPESDREKVVVMLSQLRNMGVPEDPALIADVNHNKPGVSRTGVTDTSHEGLQTVITDIDSAPVDEVFAILSEEPNWIIAVLLEAHDWTWTQAFLVSLDNDRRAAVCQLAKGVRAHITERLKGAIVVGLAGLLETAISRDKESENRFDVMLKNLEEPAVAADYQGSRD